MTRSNIYLLIGFMLAGIVSHHVGDYMAPPRIDPFTGEQGEALEKRVEALEKIVLGKKNEVESL